MKTNVKMTALAAGLAGMVAIAIVGVTHFTELKSTIVLADVPTPSVKPDPALIARPVSVLSVNDNAIALIMNNEGLELEPYQFAGKWYVGYGHGRTAHPEMRITATQAEKLLRDDLKHFERDVRRLVKVPLTEDQFSALVSFVYNVGSGTFSRSSVLRHVNNGDMQAAADALMLYTKASVNGEKLVLNSLVKRRKGERRLFLGQPQMERTLRT